MSLARFKGVLICSSEEKVLKLFFFFGLYFTIIEKLLIRSQQNYPASNLISDSNKKWKCEECGMDSVYVVLQLENPTKINGIDIGNENSAFIEVAVGRTGWPIEKFKVCVVPLINFQLGSKLYLKKTIIKPEILIPFVYIFRRF